MCTCLAASRNDSEMTVGWIPLRSRISAALSRAPAITVTVVVPSPASTSCEGGRRCKCVGRAKGCCHMVQLRADVRPAAVARHSTLEHRAVRRSSLRCGLRPYVTALRVVGLGVWHETCGLNEKGVGVGSGWEEMSGLGVGNQTFGRTCDLDRSTSIFAVGCATSICLRMVAPSFVITTSPLGDAI